MVRIDIYIPRCTEKSERDKTKRRIRRRNTIVRLEFQSVRLQSIGNLRENNRYVYSFSTRYNTNCATVNELMCIYAKKCMRRVPPIEVVATKTRRKRRRMVRDSNCFYYLKLISMYHSHSTR